MQMCHHAPNDNASGLHKLAFFTRIAANFQFFLPINMVNFSYKFGFGQSSLKAIASDTKPIRRNMMQLSSGRILAFGVYLK